MGRRPLDELLARNRLLRFCLRGSRRSPLGARRGRRAGTPKPCPRGALATAKRHSMSKAASCPASSDHL
eukprot:3362589-Pyramimonas_sp.AAC.1